jgi:hypothetical protein
MGCGCVCFSLIVFEWIFLLGSGTPCIVCFPIVYVD